MISTRRLAATENASHSLLPVMLMCLLLSRNPIFLYFPLWFSSVDLTARNLYPSCSKNDCLRALFYSITAALLNFLMTLPLIIASVVNSDQRFHFTILPGFHANKQYFQIMIL
jgi:hypothetical protein